MREHPLVEVFREKGLDPERVELLRVRHERFGHRWVLLDDARILIASEAFAEFVEGKGVVDKLEEARTVILQAAPQFATNPLFLLPAADDNDEKRDALQLLYHAAAFLLRCGIVNVDQDTTETNFGWPNNETISQRPTLH